jgi:hypothetical protein
MKQKILFPLLFLCLFLMSSCGDKAQKDLPLSKDFDVMMGKNTAWWGYIKKKEDVEMLNRYRALYEKNKHVISALPQKNVKIPKVVHFIWLGPKPFPSKSVENVRTWMAQHPSWTFKFWTDRDRPTPCNGMQKVFVKDFSFFRLQHCYVQSQNYGEKSDILRYEILHREGGVYVDHDANCLRSFESLHSGCDFYCGFETPHEPFVGRNLTCGNGVIGSRPHHPVVKKVIDLIALRWDALGKKFQGRDEYSRSEVVMQRTYIALTNAIDENIDKDNNVDLVLPSAYFFSKHGISPLFSQHFYAVSWGDQKNKRDDFEKDSQKLVSRLKKKASNVYFFTFALGVLNIGFFLWLFSLMRKKLKDPS